MGNLGPDVWRWWYTLRRLCAALKRKKARPTPKGWTGQDGNVV
jgi:hypothetical protein